MRTALLILAALAASASGTHADNLVANAGFEEGENGWNRPFIPTDSESAGATSSLVFEGAHSGEACLMLETSAQGRVGISPKKSIEVEPGQKYRLSGWIKAQEGFEVVKGTPGILLRVTMRDGTADAPGGHFHLAWDGKSSRGQVYEIATDAPATEWTHATTEFIIPDGVNRINLDLFLWGGVGRAYFDDVVLERIGS